MFLDRCPSQWDTGSRCLAVAKLTSMVGVATGQGTGFVRFYEIQSGWNNRYIKKFVIETRIHSGLRFNLLIMIGRIRDRRVGLIPHLLTSGLIPSLMVCLS
jgi:hypothetical protein